MGKYNSKTDRALILEVALYISIAVECLIPAYIHPRVFGFSITVRSFSITLMTVSLLINIDSLIYHRYQISALSKASLISLIIFLLLTITSAIFDGQFIIYLRKELALALIMMISGVLLSRDAEFIKRLSFGLAAIAAVVICVEYFEYSAHRNPLLPMANDISGIYVPTALRGEAYRSFATFEHPLILAEFLSLSACFFLYLIFTGKLLVKSLGGGMLILCFIGSLETNTRSSTVILVASLTTYILLRVPFASKRYAISLKLIMMLTIGIIFAFGSALLLYLTAPLISGRNKEEYLSSSARLQMHRLGLPHLFDHINGFGYGKATDIAGLMIDGRLAIDDYFLIVALNSGVFAAFFLIASISLNYTSLIVRGLSRGGRNDEQALYISVATVWTSCSIVQGSPALHYIYYLIFGCVLANSGAAVSEGLKTRIRPNLSLSIDQP